MYAASYTSRPSGACIGQFGFGTAVAVYDANTMVTAKHVDASTVVVEGTTHTVTASYPHPDADVDLRVIKVTPALPRFSALPDENPNLLDSYALGGTGFTATGATNGTLVNSRAERWCNNDITEVFEVDNGYRFSATFDSSGGEPEEGIACLHDSGGYVGTVDGATCVGIITGGFGGSIPLNYGMVTAGVLLWHHRAWIESKATDSAKPIPLHVHVDWNASPPTAELEITGAVTWLGDARDFKAVEADGTVWGNITDPAEEGATTTMTFELEEIDTGGDPGSWSLAEAVISDGSSTNVAVTNSGYLESEASMAGPALSTVSVVFGTGTTSTVTIVWDQACTLDLNDPNTAGDGSENTSNWFSLCYPWGQQNSSGFNNFGTTVTGDGTATHTLTVTAEATAESVAGTAQVNSVGSGVGERYGSGPGGQCVDVNNFPYSCSATEASSLTAASVAPTAWRVRQKTAGLTGTATVTKKDPTANIRITVWAVIGTTLTEVATGTGTGFSAVTWDCVEGVKYLIYSRSNSGSINVGWDYTEAPPAAAGPTTRTVRNRRTSRYNRGGRRPR